MSLPYEIGVRAEVVVEDVLDNLKLEDLVDYIAKRKGGSQVLQALPDMTELRDAVARDDGRRCVDILRPLFFAPDLEKVRARYDALPRAIETRRPLVI